MRLLSVNTVDIVTSLPIAFPEICALYPIHFTVNVFLIHQRIIQAIVSATGKASVSVPTTRSVVILERFVTAKPFDSASSLRCIQQDVEH